MQLIQNTIQVTCLNQYHQEADFVVGFKYPQSYNFNFMTDLMTELVDSDVDISDPENLFQATLEQIYDQNQPIGNRSQIYIYNDGTSTGTYGHMKGVVAYDPVDGTGFWLTHSIPKYPFLPPQNESYLTLNDLQYPQSGYKNAQHLLCLTITEETFLELSEALYIDRPGIGYIHISDEYLAKSQYLRNMNENTYNHRSPTGSYKDLKTKNNMPFKLFYKNSYWAKDLWGDLIQPTLNQSMYLNTWLQVGMNDTEFVTKICQIESCVDSCQQWSSTSDHSKLGVTQNAEYTCFSDINFDSSQNKRGGGATCLRDVNLGQEMLRRAKTIRQSGPKC